MDKLLVMLLIWFSFIGILDPRAGFGGLGVSLMIALAMKAV